jgi:sRNA-binding regulator protein Hfq
MPREVFADEIERFLETLDGVSSARVLTGPDGDISYVYVTTESALGSRGLRHGVVAALQSRFGIPIDDWRVRVTQLRAGVQPSEIPHFRVVRVEETATAADLAVTVKLQWTRGADVRSATGQARGRGGAPQRSRALAAATIAAVRDALDVPHDDLTLDRVGAVMFLDRPVVLVAVSARTAGEPEAYIGAAFEAAAPDEAAEPAIAAALDAVTRWLLHAAFAAGVPRSPHRRDHLEAMRHFVADAASQTDGPIPLRAPHHAESEPAAEAAEGASRHGTASRTAPVRALPPRSLGVIQNGQTVAIGGSPSTPSGAGRPAPSGAGRTSPTAGQSRGSETKGGTAMGLQHDTPDAGAGMRAARASSVEDGFYRSLVVERTPVHLRCRDGYEVARAIVRDAGSYALLVETADGLELFFKHAIISIRVLPKPAAQA